MTEDQEDTLYRTLLALDEKVGRLLAVIESNRALADCPSVQERLEELAGALPRKR